MKPGEMTKFAGVKSKTDSGLRPPKTVMFTDETIRVTKLKGENFGRIAINVIAKYISEGHLQKNLDLQMGALEQLR